MHEFEWLAVHVHVAKREARGLVHFFVVVDHDDAPAGQRAVAAVLRFLGEADPLVFHPRVSSPAAGATTGNSTMKLAPGPAPSSNSMLPPSRPCTRLYTR